MHRLCIRIVEKILVSPAFLLVSLPSAPCDWQAGTSILSLNSASFRPWRQGEGGVQEKSKGRYIMGNVVFKLNVTQHNSPLRKCCLVWLDAQWTSAYRVFTQISDNRREVLTLSVYHKSNVWSTQDVTVLPCYLPLKNTFHMAMSLK